MSATAPGPRALASWCLYDWAGQGFPTVIATFVFAAYFTQSIAADPVGGTDRWGTTVSAAALAIALAAPVLGAIADRAGRRKPWILTFTALCVVSVSMLWWSKPQPGYVVWTLVFVAIAEFSFEMANVFYNAMLPDLAPRRMIGRLSGWGWGLGYSGGIVCLLVALGLYSGFLDPGWLALDRDSMEHVRASALLVAAWYALFAVPLFLFTPDTAATGIPARRAAREGVTQLWRTLRRARRDHPKILRFLVARMIYTDGLNTLFAFGGIYAAGTFGMDIGSIMLFGVMMNVTAGLGAAAFAWVDDWIGPKPVILISIGALTVLGGALLVVETETLFWVFGLPVGLFVGPSQAASRSLMARVAPEHLRNEMFGLFAFSGKATAFVGPFLVGSVTALTGSQRWGMSTILAFFVVGMALLWRVPNPPRG